MKQYWTGSLRKTAILKVEEIRKEFAEWVSPGYDYNLRVLHHLFNLMCILTNSGYLIEASNFKKEDNRLYQEAE